MSNVMNFLRKLLGYQNPVASDFGPEDEELNNAALNNDN